MSAKPRYQVRFQPEWPDQLDALLMGFEVIDDPAHYRREVEAGGLTLAMLTDHRDDQARDLCHLLFRLETVDGGRLEFVAVACVAVDPHSRRGDLTDALVQACTPFALAYDCSSLRVHTARPGLIMKLAERGFETIETVMRKRLPAKDMPALKAVG